MNEHIETPETDDVEGHVQFADDGFTPGPPTRRPLPVTAEDDDVEGHVLDLDVERRR
jgi:hypothetical protein